MRAWAAAAALGIGAILIGMLTPWFTAGTSTAAPFEGIVHFRIDDALNSASYLDGIIVVSLAAVALLILGVFAAGRLPGPGSPLVVAGLSCLILVVAILQFEFLTVLGSRGIFGIDSGIGLWLVTGGAIAAIVGGLVGAQWERIR